MLIFMVEDGNRVYDGVLITDSVTIKRYSVIFSAKY